MHSVAFSPDSKQVICVTVENAVQIWDTKIRTTYQQSLKGHQSFVTAVAISPNGKQVVSGSYDGPLLLWDTMTGMILQTLEGPDSTISAAFSSNGKQIVSGSDNGTVWLWDAVRGIVLHTLDGHTNPVDTVAFSPNGKQVASGCQSCFVNLLATRTGLILQTLEDGDRDQVTSYMTFRPTSLAFSPNGERIACGYSDGTVELGDTATGANLLTLEASDWVSSVAFSPDSEQVLTGSENGALQLWDTRTGTILQTLEGRATFSSVGELEPTLFAKGDWIVEGGRRILWLPPDYRASNSKFGSTCQAAWNKVIALGHSSGRISIFQFKEGQRSIE